jgi:hypothetical protein
MKKTRPLFWAALFLFLVIGISACQVREKGRKPGPDWSRSVPLGVFVRGDIDMVVNPDGRITHLVWLKEGEEQNQVNYMQIDETATVQLDRDLDLPLIQLRRPQILPAGSDKLHLFWSSRPDGRREWDLNYVQLDETGQLVGDLKQLAGPDDDVARFVKAADGQGGIYLAWEAKVDGAIYGSHIATDGAILQEAVRLVDQGTRPSLAVDGDTLYMTWMDESDVMYATWPQGRLSLDDGVSLISIPIPRGSNMDGPELGVAGEWTYVIWSIFNSTGLEAGTAATEYIAFPKESPQRLNAQKLRISPDEEPPYLPHESAYQITQLAPPLGGPAGPTDFVREPGLTDSRGDELAVALVLNQDLRLDTMAQIGMAIFKDGQFDGYQMAGKTDSFSQEPVLATDDEGNLHIAWREGGHGSLAYYAVTTAEGRAELDRLQANDVANVALSGGIEVIAGMLFFPLACIWLVHGLFLIGLWHLWRGDSDLNNKGTIIVLIISIVVSQVMKFLFLPTITTYVPFSAWLDVSPSWQQPLLFIVPLLTLLAGLLVAFLMHRRTPSGLAFFFWFTATDAILTLAIYGVTILGVF